jgi:serine/threonine protein phosphatase PrpC
VQDEHAWWAHLGDSRLYLVRNGAVHCRTRDHTPVEEMLQNGLLSDDDLRTHPMRNTVSRCLGGEPALPKTSFGNALLEHADTLLLCSDGLWSALDEQRLCDLPAESDTFESRINQLTDEADVATYPRSDNISLAGLHWLAEQPEPQPEAPAGDAAGSPPDTPAADPADPLQQAIEDIHRAMLDYGDEMKK